MEPVESQQVTTAMAKVLRALVDRPGYAYNLMRTTGFSSGKLYPILRQLLDLNWVDRIWDRDDDRHMSTPPRRQFKLTPIGIVAAQRATREGDL